MLSNSTNHMIADAPQNSEELYLHYQSLAEAENINPQTLLATDYLNHFNEVHMLLDMLSDMPDCLEDIQEWQEKSYEQHFMDSSFHAKKLAIDAYHHSPAQHKIPFEETVDSMNTLVLTTIEQAEKMIADGDSQMLRDTISLYKPLMEELIEQCSAIINGTKHIAHQEDIDSYFSESPAEGGIDQNAIDDLFD